MRILFAVNMENSGAKNKRKHHSDEQCSSINLERKAAIYDKDLFVL